ncbi:hypothetical protein JNUCC32_23850 [Paenibacillus sp. JNUCC32]|uniref:hypothetical protein n=1 Tax=Paenibacillus sp. JNUCC32 TaxID=2777984 RepID=UPI001787D4FE|nr:hypothetical protein [Paenibacillus sp. JNUCC-32]QOT09166.1 hypothetical protein JNUCC32_23850 [Paenibacillus sp. JNUCC-32]
MAEENGATLKLPYYVLVRYVAGYVVEKHTPGRDDVSYWGRECVRLCLRISRSEVRYGIAADIKH